MSDIKHVCADCIGDSYLSNLVEKEGEDGTCDYCGLEGKCITTEELADHVQGAFERHFTRTSTEPDDSYSMLQAREGKWERGGDDVVNAIANAAEIDTPIAEDVQKILDDRHEDYEAIKAGEECEFSRDSYYEQIGANDVEFRQEWQGVEQSLKKENRHFNKSAESTLKTVFDGVTEHVTHEGKKIVVEAGPGKEITSLFRGRVFQSLEPLKEALKRPDAGVGPPPSHSANAGRMNARGISVFYGARDPSVALAEIRPPVGSHVVVGRFELLRELRLLDVDALQSVYVDGSVFDPSHIKRLERSKFLGRLAQRISAPVMPNDEASDYLITQAMADYLASELQLDGIIYPSAQAGGAPMNVVLFQHAARVKPMEFPAGTELEADTHSQDEDGFYPDFSVWEKVPKEKPAEKKEDEFEFFGFRPGRYLNEGVGLDMRDFTLAVDPASVKVHRIKAVQFDTEDHEVRRHRMEKNENLDF